ncbi:MAG: YbhB/YbcL family Raf kinase inhibitor-like protein [Nanoarchaeota archaeon]|nr:YbhB/YbcL family Raf kinase inhibitor-like protein [Nanoarchaeota archaeon]
MQISSPAFQHNGTIPVKYTCQGDNINPEIIITNVPEDTVTLVLIIDDPDAPMGVWDHWVLYNIPKNTSKINENSMPAGALQAKNSWGKKEYGGPCPPNGTHRYYFKIYALNTRLNLSDEADKEELEQMMSVHVIAQSYLMAKYSKE